MVARKPQVTETMLDQDPPLIADPVETAQSAGLRYFTDARPGIRRKRAGKHFRYIGPDGETIRDTAELQRIKAIGIPPAWTDVWICPSPRGHLQATGRDAKGRKQYRYHPRWREVRDETKYTRMIAFGEALPMIRERANLDLTQQCLSREKVLATVVTLLDLTAIRVGNEEYARENQSYGLTTMRTRHVQVKGATLHFHFQGKSHKEHVLNVRHQRLARAVRRCQDLPGHELFQYLDDDGERHAIDSGDVNDYLRTITGENFTAKDFRTWHGTVRAAEALASTETAESETETKRRVTAAIEVAASHLGNTPAICRKSYVHPAVIESYLDGSLYTTWRQVVEEARNGSTSGLDPDETVVLA
ncbi:MAG TPA: DNA topoisomerase IB, partial [Chloroflexota bacterium]